MAKLPDFLCIGAQKAGTTWLYANMGAHPEIWLPPRKELHYFDWKYPPQCSYTSVAPDQDKDTRRPQGSMNKQGLTVSRFTKLRNYSFNRLLWEAKYRFRRRSDEWYSSLFSKGEGKIAGDFTPAYSVLDHDAVSDIFRLMPRARIIFCIRDPIDRAWSHAKMVVARRLQRSVQGISKREWLQHFRSPDSVLRGDYVRTVDIWEEFYPRRQILTLFYDDIKMDPSGTLRRVFSFLGVESGQSRVPTTCNKRVHVGTPEQLPSELRLVLAEMYHEKLLAIENRFGGHATNWYSSAVRTLDADNSSRERVTDDRTL